MRPLGHDETRESRDAHTAPLDERLQEAWERCLALSSKREYHVYHVLFESSLRALAHIRPSIPALHHHILSTAADTEATRMALGLFITAGYQLAPEKEIVYDVQAPWVDCLGSFLTGKHLIIDGEAGSQVGFCLIGDLTINGAVDDSVGYDMYGRFSDTLGKHDGAMAWMTGLYTTPDTRSPHGTTGFWSIVPEQRTSFLAAIENPEGLSWEALYHRLSKEYEAIE